MEGLEKLTLDKGEFLRLVQDCFLSLDQILKLVAEQLLIENLPDELVRKLRAITQPGNATLGVLAEFQLLFRVD